MSIVESEDGRDINLRFPDRGRVVPVFFELDEDGEAGGTIHFYCSFKCRDAHPGDSDLSEWGTVAAGTLNGVEVDAATICEYCGALVAPEVDCPVNDPSCEGGEVSEGDEVFHVYHESDECDTPHGTFDTRAEAEVLIRKLRES